MGLQLEAMLHRKRILFGYVIGITFLLSALIVNSAKIEKIRSTFTSTTLSGSAPATPSSMTPLSSPTRASRGDFHGEDGEEDYHEYEDHDYSDTEKQKPLKDIAKMIEKELQVQARSILRGFQGMGSQIEHDFQESGEADMRRIQVLLRQHTRQLRQMLRSISDELQRGFKTMLKEARESGNDTSLYDDDLDVMSSLTSALLTDQDEEEIRGKKLLQKKDEESRTGLLSLLWTYMGLD